ncbi:excinuclease ABC subunit UvrC [Boudabousia marimammalium]|uniref:UvrABC system protein C n=1 Tax=Boudabousia marimammalium TaxID=156892 RepID=A0A1Q5PR60_9ACTO|nr:excinuclease ABC subunit UvrC [Boudabousia marimammalium]OKL50026.1 excinuclease ABC subunit C [Boudabousia marimammalium]
MSDPQSYRPATGDIPASPGVYRFCDEQGRVIYVGKAKNLRARLSSYFQDPDRLHRRTRKMVFSAHSVQWTVVATELEALTLEYSWIKEFSPHFNVMYNRNDMSFPYLAVTMNEEYPRALVMRGNRKPGVVYFGPFPQPKAIRDTLELLLKMYPVRTCSAGVFSRAKRSGRPCLLGHIGKCAAPCVGAVSTEEHRELASELVRFMSGRTGPVLSQLKAEMNAAAKSLEYEKAARIRDQIAALNSVLERNTVVVSDGVDADVVGVESDELEVSVYVLHVRGGRIRGVRGWVVERPGDQELGDFVSRALEHLYGDLPEVPAGTRAQRLKEQPASVDDVEHLSTQEVPALVLVENLWEESPIVASWLQLRRGAKVQILVPERGEKRALLERAKENAAENLRLHKAKRIGDMTRRTQALEELQHSLGLSQAPLRIECFDVSHTQGTYQVASMVVFEDGMPRKSEYRTFNIRGHQGSGAKDDTEAMAEVLTRRLNRLIAEEQDQEGEDEDGVPLRSGPVDPETGKARRFSYRPDLLVIDGGLPQVNAAQRVVEDIGLSIPVVGLAKRLEEVWVPHDDFPLILPRSSPALYLLQHLRDESHRAAITKHRARRGKAMTRSVLDQIPGLGPERQKALLSHFASMKQIRLASVEQLQEVAGIGPALAESIVANLAGESG